MASFDTLPVLSFTLYVIGVGSAVNPASGVNVISPVVLSTVHVPSPATTSVSASPSPSSSVAAGSVRFTVLALISPSGSVSFVSVGNVVGVPITPDLLSSTATGGFVNGVTVGSSGLPSLSGSTLAPLVGSSELSVVVLPSGAVPVATAWLVTPPAATSACVITCVAVKVVLSTCPTAKSTGPPVTVAFTSVTVTFVNGTFPVLVTVKV